MARVIIPDQPPIIRPNRRALQALSVQDRNQERRNAGPQYIAPTFIPEFLAEINTSTTIGAAYFKLGAGQYGYIAAGNRLTVFDQDLMTITGQTAADSTNLNNNHHCEINEAETFAFSMNEQGNDIASVNISNKAAPVVSQRFRGPSAGTSLAGANWAARDGNILFVACYSRRSVALIDITDPTAMVWIGEYRGPTAGTSLTQCRRVALDRVNKICYYACDSTSANVHRFGAFNYSNTAALTYLWSLATGDVDTNRGCYIDEEDNTILWTLSSGGANADSTIAYHGALTAWRRNLSNLGVAPTKLGQYKGYGSNYSVATAMTAPRSVAFVKDDYNGKRYALVPAESPNNITVLDVTDPTAALIYKGVIKDTAHLNSPMDIQMARDGNAIVSCLAPSGTVGRGVSKWKPNVKYELAA